MKFISVVQARMGSRRLPGKVLMKIDDRRLLIDWVLQRLERAKSLDKIVVATTTLPQDDVLVNHIQENYQNVRIFRGSETNVLSRYVEISRKYQCDYLVRITADCPLVCSKLVDEMAIEVNRHQPIYAANCNVERILKGFDVEFIKSSSLPFINYQNLTSYQLEHVTPLFYSGYFSESLIRNFFFPQHAQYSDLNFSIDTAFDLKFIREVNNMFDLFHKNFYQINALVKDVSEIKRILHMN